MKITSLLLAFASFVKGLFGFTAKAKNPFTMSDFEKRALFKKSKGGGRGKGMIAGLPKSSRAVAHPWPSSNWHMENRASWRKPRVAKSERLFA